MEVSWMARFCQIFFLIHLHAYDGYDIRYSSRSAHATVPSILAATAIRLSLRFDKPTSGSGDVIAQPLQLC